MRYYSMNGKEGWVSSATRWKSCETWCNGQR